MHETSTADVAIADLLALEGFRGAAALRARALLEEAKLTRPGKLRMTLVKAERVRRLLRERLARVCDACSRAHGELVVGREVVPVAPVECEVCAGSSNRRAGRAARRALHAAGVRRLLVLGGSPSTHAALRDSLEDEAIEVRCIDGTEGVRPAPTVEADVAWADVLVVWASTPLPHKVSQPYMIRARGRLPAVTVPRRGVEAICAELIRLLSRPAKE